MITAIIWIGASILAIMVGWKFGGALNDWSANQAAERKEREKHTGEKK